MIKLNKEKKQRKRYLVPLIIFLIGLIFGLFLQHYFFESIVSNYNNKLISCNKSKSLLESQLQDLLSRSLDHNQLIAVSVTENT